MARSRAQARARPCSLCALPTRVRWDLEAVELYGRADLVGRPICLPCRERLTDKARHDLRPLTADRRTA